MSEAISISCGRAKIIGAYELDGDKSSKELLVLNEDCKTLKQRNKVLPDKYVYLSNLEIWHYNPKTGKYDKKSYAYGLREGRVFAQKLVAATDDDAVLVKDMNNDGHQDLILKTEDRNDHTHKTKNQKITILYNDGKGNFKPFYPKK